MPVWRGLIESPISKLSQFSSGQDAKVQLVERKVLEGWLNVSILVLIESPVS